jgi:predicted proteasome-type protease
MQSKYEEIENKMNRDHDLKMKEISRNWEARVRQAEERIRDVENSANSVDN